MNKVSDEKRERIIEGIKENKRLQARKSTENTLSLNDIITIIHLCWEMKDKETTISEYNNWFYCEAEKLAYKKNQFKGQLQLTKIDTLEKDIKELKKFALECIDIIELEGIYIDIPDLLTADYKAKKEREK